MGQEYCFVLMPFRKELDDVYETIIKPAVNDLGLRCLRADEIDGAGNIIRNIIEHIYDAQIIIADLTYKNANVFYELGIAHAFGNNTIAIAQDIKENIPFDVSNYKVIEYTDSIRGAQRLTKELKKAISSIEVWSKRPSNPVQDFIPQEAREKISKAVFLEMEKKYKEISMKYENANRSLGEMEKSKLELSKLRDQNKELETYRNLFQKLFEDFLNIDEGSKKFKYSSQKDSK